MLSNYQLALNLRTFAEVFNSAPPDNDEQKQALTWAASVMLEAAKRLEQNRERRMAGE